MSGATALTDTYTLANTTPNIVYDLLLGGVFAATLVPVFVAHTEQDDDDAQQRRLVAPPEQVRDGGGELGADDRATARCEAAPIRGSSR